MLEATSEANNRNALGRGVLSYKSAMDKSLGVETSGHYLKQNEIQVLLYCIALPNVVIFIIETLITHIMFIGISVDPRSSVDRLSESLRRHGYYGAGCAYSEI